jgi:hypothetical protein
VPTLLFLRKRRRLASAGLDFVDIVCVWFGLCVWFDRRSAFSNVRYERRKR